MHSRRRRLYAPSSIVNTEQSSMNSQVYVGYNLCRLHSILYWTVLRGEIADLYSIFCAVGKYSGTVLSIATLYAETLNVCSIVYSVFTLHFPCTSLFRAVPCTTVNLTPSTFY